MPVRYNSSSVWVRLSIFSQLSIIQNMGLCVFSLPISFVMIERIYILFLIIIIKSEVWTITHCLGLCHETMVCAVCLSIFFRMWLVYIFTHNTNAQDIIYFGNSGSDQNSSAVGIYAECCSDHSMGICMRAKRCHHRIWMTIDKPLCCEIPQILAFVVYTLECARARKYF